VSTTCQWVIVDAMVGGTDIATDNVVLADTLFRPAWSVRGHGAWESGIPGTWIEHRQT